MVEKILELLENNSDLTSEQLSIMIDKPVEDVEKAIKEYKEKNIIVANKTVINWDKTDKEFVTALIELKVTPQRGEGFVRVSYAYGIDRINEAMARIKTFLEKRR